MLQKLASFAGIQGPVVTIVMDGYGIPKSDAGSAIAAARKARAALPEADKRLLLMHALVAAMQGRAGDAWHLQALALG